MSRSRLLALSIGLMSLLAAAPAHAVLITVNFTVTGDDSDPVNTGVTASGSFSFDSSIIPPLGGFVNSPATSGFNLTWDGTSWTDANTTTESVSFNASGDLTSFRVYGDPGGSGSELFPNPVDDFFLRLSASGTRFTYTREGVSTPYEGTFDYSVTTESAPEPASWMLLGAGLLGLVGTVRRFHRV